MFNPLGRLPLWRRPFVMSDIIIGNTYCQEENKKNSKDENKIGKDETQTDENTKIKEDETPGHKRMKF